MKLPERIIRLDDGEEFILKPNGMYSIRSSIELEKEHGCLCHEYSYETLMINNKGSFKVADGTEDLESMRNDWIKRFERDCNCGCGCDEDDGC